jgi:TonB family protein
MMAHQHAPVPLPEESQETGRSSATGTRNLVTPISNGQTAEEVMAVLREQLASDPLNYDAFLEQVVRHAKALTGASGAAVALRDQEVVLCRAKCGESGPPIGAEVDLASGISGECLRTGRALDCKDTETDNRVDARACRDLGLRSIAVVPIHGPAAVGGILEVFSPWPNAFDDAQLRILARLAEVVTVADTGFAALDTAGSQPSAEPPLTRDREAPVVPPTSNSAPSEPAKRWFQIRDLRSTDYYLAVAALVFVFAAALVIWKPTGVPAAPAAQPTHSRHPSLTTPETEPSTGSRGDLNAAEPAVPGQHVAGPRTDTRTSFFDPNSEPRLEQPSGGEAILPSNNRSPAVIVPPERSLGRKGTETTPLEAPPAVPAQQSDALSSIFSVDAALPQSGFSAFQGVSGGTLERSVKPTYPPEALTLGLEGSVVLQAVIDEDGRVREVKAISGDPVLVRAAIDAVSQWRYRPYLLNGHPTKRQTQITLSFKLP